MDFALEDGLPGRRGSESAIIKIFRNENGIHLRPYEAKVFLS